MGFPDTVSFFVGVCSRAGGFKAVVYRPASAPSSLREDP